MYSSVFFNDYDGRQNFVDGAIVINILNQNPNVTRVDVFFGSAPRNLTTFVQSLSVNSDFVVYSMIQYGTAFSSSMSYISVVPYLR